MDRVEAIENKLDVGVARMTDVLKKSLCRFNDCKDWIYLGVFYIEKPSTILKSC